MGSDGQSKPKKKTLDCYFKSAWKNQIFTVNIRGKEQSFSGEVLSGRDGDENATCTVCGMKFSVRHGGRNDVTKHFSHQKHFQSISANKTSPTLTSLGFGESEAAKRVRKKQEEQQQQVQKAEALFVQFVAEHNLPFRTGDCFTKLAKAMFPDSEVA